ncbi:MAG: amino acid racemase [Planctomycetota bacterium]|nr:amino acid racemase [Planctomycetota bacterium]
MKVRRSKIVGVLGGLGPEAALAFCQRLLERTPGVRRDQDHLRVILDNNAKIPDRTAALAGRGPSPAPEAIRSARLLQRAGAAFIAIPCNTVQRWHPEISRAVRIPVLNLVEITVNAARKRAQGGCAIGLLATDGTRRAGLYDACLARRKLAPVHATEAEQRRVMAAIVSIKAGRGRARARTALRQIARALGRRGAGAIVLGCTEVGLVLKDGDAPVPLVDSLDALVEETLRRALPRSAR